MFLKRKKLAVAIGREEKSVRFLCILQLVVVFSVLCWNLGYPFLGAIYEVKQEKNLYDYVFSAERASYYAELPVHEKVWLEKRNAFWKGQLDKSFREKFKESLRHMYFKMPRLELLWVVLSVVLCVMTLRQREGFRAAMWLLPIITVAFVFENIAWGEHQKPKGDEVLYPNEKTIIAKYVPEGLSGSVSDQKAGLERGWEEYLKKEWGRDDLKRGEFAFAVARIKAREREGVTPLFKRPLEREPMFLLALYLFWNTFLAWKISKYKPLEVINTDSAKIPNEGWKANFS